MQTNKKENNPGSVASEISKEVIDSSEVSNDDEGKALEKAIESSKKLRSFKATEPEL